MKKAIQKESRSVVPESSLKAEDLRQALKINVEGSKVQREERGHVMTEGLSRKGNNPRQTLKINIGSSMIDPQW